MLAQKQYLLVVLGVTDHCLAWPARTVAMKVLLLGVTALQTCKHMYLWLCTDWPCTGTRNIKPLEIVNNHHGAGVSHYYGMFETFVYAHWSRNQLSQVPADWAALLGKYSI